MIRYKQVLSNLYQVLIAIDQLLFCILGTIMSIANPKIKIYADMTISANMHRLSKKGSKLAWIAERLINLLFIFIERDHCAKAYQSELDRKHMPDDLK